MAIFTGLNISNYLSDVDNKSQSLRNLGLDRRDFNRIRGLNEVITTDQLHMLSGLDEDYEKTSYSLYRSAVTINNELKNIGDFTEGLDFNVRLNNQLRAGAIKYKYISHSASGATTNKSADISTSRVSSWSQFSPGGPIFYGADVNVKGDTANNETIVQLEDIVFTGNITPKRFAAEVPTETITVNVNGTDRELYTMRNIPVKFDGYFRSGTITYRIDDTTILPTVNFIDLPAYPQGVPINGTANTANNTATYSRSVTPSDKTIELYYRPAGIEELTLSPINMTKLPNVILPNLRKIDLRNNLLPAFPDFFNISGGNLSTPATNSNGTDFREVIMSGNPFYKETQDDPTKTAHEQLKNRLTASVQKLEISGCFSDSTPIDISLLKAGGGNINFVSSQLKNFTMSAKNDTGTVSMTDTGTTPKVNPATLESYVVDHQGYSTISHSVVSAPSLLSANFTHCGRLSSAEHANNTPGAVVSFASTELKSVNLSHTEVPVVDMSGKAKLESYTHTSSEGFGQPASGSFDGFFTGCIKLKTINLDSTYAGANTQTVFQNLPELTAVNLKNTRMKGKMTPGTFNGTTKLQTFRCTGGLFESEAGVNNFFGNSFVDVDNPEPSGDVGVPFEGGYYAGKMLGDSNEEYYLIVCDKAHEVTKSRYKINPSQGGDGTQGIADVRTGLDNTQAEYGTDIDYDAAKYALDLTANLALTTGYDDWYIPAQNELELMYRNFKPTNTVNDVNSGNNPHSVPSYTATYSNNGNNPQNPVRTSLADFQAGGSQAFESTPGSDKVLNSTFDTSANWQTFHGATTSPGFTSGLLNVLQDTTGTGSEGTTGNVADSIIGNAGIFQTLTLPAGTYDVDFDVQSATYETTSSGSFVEGQSYKIVTVGSVGDTYVPAANINFATDTINIPNHGYTANTIVTVNQQGAGLEPLTVSGNHYVKVVDSDNITLSSSLGGTDVDFSIAYDSYTINITGSSGTDHYIISGSDSGGSVSGNDPQITADVGDTLTFDNGVVSQHPLRIMSDKTVVASISDVSAGGATDATDNELIFSSPHGFTDGDEVTATTSSFYADVDNGESYFVDVVDSTTLKLNTDSGLGSGTVVDIDATNTSAASGVSLTLTKTGTVQAFGVSGNATATVTFTPPAPGTYYYQCSNHASMVGEIVVIAKNGPKNINLVYALNENWQQVGNSGTPTVGDTFTMDATEAATTSNGATLPSGAQVRVFSSDATEDDFVYGSVTTGSDPKLGIDISQFSYRVSNGQITTTNPKFTLSAETDLHIKLEAYSANFVANRASITSRDGYYWSSTESSADQTQGIAQSFISGEQIDVAKTDTYYVRPVRRVNVASGTQQEVEYSSALFEPCKGELTTFELKGQGRETDTPEANIRGKLPDLSFLESISTFTITDTQLQGLIPNFEISTQLSTLTLSNNKFTGLFSLKNQNVKKVSVNHNELTGVSSLDAPLMWFFDASHNDIIGTVPNFDLCPEIQQINLSNNGLTGFLASTIVSNLELRKLNLQNNNLTEGTARRILQDLKDNYNAGNTNKVTLNLKLNPAVSESRLLGYSDAISNINFLRSKGWTLSFNP